MSTNDAPHVPSLVTTEQMQLCLPSRPDWIDPAVEFLRQKAVLCGACTESRSPKLMIALHEALSNAIIHGNLELSSELKERGDNSFAEALAQRVSTPYLAERLVDVLVDYDGQRCRWIITDQGTGFDHARALQRADSDDPELLLASGRGILLMRSFLDEIAYEYGGRRLILTMKRESGEEKRHKPRLPLHEPLRVAPIRPDGTVDWDAAYEAVSRNFSANGVALLQEGLASTQRVLIGILAGNRPIYIPAEIRHCRNLSGDVVELGCHFQTQSPASAAPDSDAAAAMQNAINTLLEARDPTLLPKDNRRSHQRVVFNERIEVETPNERVTAFTRDLSKGGIAFITTLPLALEVSVVFLPRDHGPSLRVRAQVVRCNKIKDGLYDIGARFLELAPT
jgi:anti-sigma regulatory factor (Ser/Thr protein kinase)